MMVLDPAARPTARELMNRFENDYKLYVERDLDVESQF